MPPVALRKESVDRNAQSITNERAYLVALRKESVDRNILWRYTKWMLTLSLSARRAWIEIRDHALSVTGSESSLSARRAWIEMQ